MQSGRLVDYWHRISGSKMYQIAQDMCVQRIMDAMDRHETRCEISTQLKPDEVSRLAAWLRDTHGIGATVIVDHAVIRCYWG